MKRNILITDNMKSLEQYACFEVILTSMLDDKITCIRAPKPPSHLLHVRDIFFYKINLKMSSQIMSNFPIIFYLLLKTWRSEVCLSVSLCLFLL